MISINKERMSLRQESSVDLGETTFEPSMVEVKGVRYSMEDGDP